VQLLGDPFGAPPHEHQTGDDVMLGLEADGDGAGSE
jgi:hypothetical protein